MTTLQAAAQAHVLVVRRGRRLELLTIGWNLVEAIVSVGAGVIAVWAVGLVRQAGRALVDREMDHPLSDGIRKTLEADGETRVTDLHIWRVGRGHFSAAISVVSEKPHTTDEYRARLACHKELVHLTIEVVQA